MGLPEALLERARTLAGGSSVGLESAIARLEAREAALGRDAERLARQKPPRVRPPMRSGRPRRRSPAASATSATGHGRRSRPRSPRRARRSAAWSAVRRRGEPRAPPRPAARSWPASGPRRWPSSRVPTRPPSSRRRRWSWGRACASNVSARTASIAQLPDGRGRAKVTVGKMTVEVGADELRPIAGPPRQVARARCRRQRGGRPGARRASLRRRAGAGLPGELADRRPARADGRRRAGCRRGGARSRGAVGPEPPGRRSRPRHGRPAQAGPRLSRRVALRRPLGPRHVPTGRRRRQHRRAALTARALAHPNTPTARLIAVARIAVL